MPDQLLIPEKAQNDVMVPIEESALQSSLTDISEFCKSTGLMELSPSGVNQLRRAGIAMEHLGTTNLTQPAVLATQQAMLQLINKAAKRCDEKGLPVDQLSKLLHSIGYLGEKVTRASMALNDTALERSGPQQAVGKARRPSPPPGYIVDVQAVPVSQSQPK